MSQGTHPQMVIYRFDCMLFLAYMERLDERGERERELFERLESIRQNDCFVIHFCHSYESESVLCEKFDGLIESR